MGFSIDEYLKKQAEQEEQEQKETQKRFSLDEYLRSKNGQNSTQGGTTQKRFSLDEYLSGKTQSKAQVPTVTMPTQEQKPVQSVVPKPSAGRGNNVPMTDAGTGGWKQAANDAPPSGIVTKVKETVKEMKPIYSTVKAAKTMAGVNATQKRNNNAGKVSDAAYKRYVYASEAVQTASTYVDDVAKKYGAKTDENGMLIFQTQEGVDAYNAAVQQYQTAMSGLKTAYTDYYAAANAYDDSVKDYQLAIEEYKKTGKYKKDKAEYDKYLRYENGYYLTGRTPAQIEKEITELKHTMTDAEQGYGANTEEYELDVLRTNFDIAYRALDTAAPDYREKSEALINKYNSDVAAVNKKYESQRNDRKRKLADLEEQLDYSWYFYVNDIQSRKDFEEKSKWSYDADTALYYHAGEDLGMTSGELFDGASSPVRYGANPKEKFAKQIETYHYIYNTEGVEAANAYMDYILPVIRQSNGEVLADKTNFPVLREIVAGAAGIETGFTGLVNFLLEDPLPTSSLGYASSEIGRRLANSDSWWERGPARIATSAAQSAGNMVPGIAAGMIDPTLGSAVFGTSVAGTAYKEYRDAGLDADNARVGGLLRGVSEVLTQNLLGGLRIPGFSGIFTGKTAEFLGSKVGSAVGKAAITYGVDVLSEVIEENAQNYIEPAINLLIGAADKYEAPGFGEFLETTFSTILLTGVMNAPNLAADVRNNKQSAQYQKKIINPWVEEVLKARDNGEAYAGSASVELAEQIQEQLAEGVSIDYQEFQEQLISAIKADAEKFGGNIQSIEEIKQARLATQQEQSGQGMSVPTVDEVTGEQGKVAMNPSDAPEARHLPLGKGGNAAADNAVHGNAEARQENVNGIEMNPTTADAVPLPLGKGGNAAADNAVHGIDAEDEGAGRLEQTVTAANAVEVNQGNQNIIGGEQNAEQQAGVRLYEGGQWNDGAGAGGQAGAVAEDAGQAAEESKGLGRAEKGRSNLLLKVQAAGIERTDSKGLGLKKGTSAKTLTEVTGRQEFYTDDMLEIEELLHSKGVETVRWVVGRMEITKGKSTESIGGVFIKADGSIILRADSLDVWGNAKHELFHALAYSRAGTVQDIADYIVNELGQGERLKTVLSRYIYAYGGVYFEDDNGIVTDAEEEYNHMLYDMMMEELLADAYAGNIRAQRTGANQFTDTVRGQTEGMTVDRENNAAYRSRNGMDGEAAEMFSLDGETGHISEETKTLIARHNFTQDDVDSIRRIGRKSVNDFTSEDIQKSEKWAKKFYRELGVKSPFFRAWFGDWRAFDTTRIAYVPVNTDFTNLYNIPRGEFLNSDTAWNITTTRDGIDETANKSGKGSSGYRALADIDKMLRNAILLDTVVVTEASKRLGSSAVFMHHLYCPVNMNGTKGIAKLYVAEQISGAHKFYLTKIEEIPTAKVSTQKESFDPRAKSTTGEISSAISVCDIFSFVKENDAKFEKNSKSSVRFNPKNVNPIFLNADGTPKVFYHGTQAKNIEVFRQSEDGALGKGIYFVESKEYADGWSINGHTYACYLSAKNPYIVNYPGVPSQDTLIENGYDAVYHKGNGFAVMFNPNQIKSATDNIGTFDSYNPDIRYSLEDDNEVDWIGKQEPERVTQKETAKRQTKEPAVEQAVQEPEEIEWKDNPIDAKKTAEIAQEKLTERAKKMTQGKLQNAIKTENARIGSLYTQRKGLIAEGASTTAVDGKIAQTEKTVQLYRQELERKKTYEKEHAAQKRQQRIEKRRETAAKKAEEIAQKAKEEKPVEAQKNFVENMQQLFSTKDGSKADTKKYLFEFGQEMLTQGYVSDEDVQRLMDYMIAQGAQQIVAEDYFQDIRRDLKGTTVYIDESVKSEFGDDWESFRKMAWGKGIYFTSRTDNRNAQAWDSLNAVLAEDYPGVFDADATDARQVLETIVEAAENGAPVMISERVALQREAQQWGISTEERLDLLEKDVRAQIAGFAAAADIEVKTKAKSFIAQARQRAENTRKAEEAAQRRQDDETRRQVLKQCRRLQAMAKRTAPELKEQIEAVLSDIDTLSRGLTTEGIENLSGLAAWYTDKMLNDPNFIGSDYLEKHIGRLDQMHIDDMSIEDVMELGKTVAALTKQAENSKMLLDEHWRATIDEGAKQLKQELQDAKGIKAEAGKVTQTADGFFNYDLVSPKRFFGHITGWVENGIGQKLYEVLEHGQQRSMNFIKNAEAIFSEFSKAQKKWLRKATGKDAEIITVRGAVLNPDGSVAEKSLQITPMMRVSLLMHYQNRQNLLHIQKSGIIVPDIKAYNNGDFKKAFDKGSRVQLEPTEIKKIIDECTQNERAFAKLLKRYFDGYSKEHINEVSMTIDGFERAMYNNYFPINTSDMFLQSTAATKKDSSIGNDPRIMNERINGTNPIVLLDAVKVLTDNIERNARYYGLAIPVRDVEAMRNYSFYRDGESGGNALVTSMQQIIREKWGSEAWDYIDKLLTDLQPGGTAKDRISTVMGRLRSNMAGATLMFNPSVALSQAASYPAALAYLRPESMLYGLELWNKSDVNLINKYTPIYWYRNQGNSTQELSDATKQEGLERKLPWLMNWIQKMDAATVRRIWVAAEHQVAKETGLAPGTQAEIDAGTDLYYQKVAELFNRVVLDTQPNYTQMERPQILRSESDLTKAITMFKTVGLQYYNVMYEASDRAANANRRYEANKSEENKAAKEKAAKNAAKAYGAILASNTVYVVMRSLIRMLTFRGDDYRDKDENSETFGEYTYASVLKQQGIDLLETYCGSVIGLGTVFSAAKSWITGEKFYGPELSALSFITDAFDAVGKFTKIESWESALDAIKEAAKLAGQGLKGLPTENIEKYLLAVTKWIAPEWAARYENLFDQIEKTDLKSEHGRQLAAAISVLLDNRAELNDEAKEEITRLWSEGWTGGVPNAVSAKVSLSGYEDEFGDPETRETVLNGKQLAEYREIWSDTVSGAMGELMNSTVYQDANDKQKAAIIKKLYDFADNYAKSTLFPQTEGAEGYVKTDRWISEGIKAQKDGLSIGKYIVTYTDKQGFESEKDEDGKSIGGSVDRQMADSIAERSDLSDAEKCLAYISCAAEKNSAAARAMYDGGMSWDEMYSVVSIDGKDMERADQVAQYLQGEAALPVLKHYLTDTQYDSVAAGVGMGVDASWYTEVKLNADKDKSGSVSGEEAKTYIRRMSGLTQQQKAVLWQMIVPANTKAKNNAFNTGAANRFVAARSDIADDEDDNEIDWDGKP